MNSPPEVHELLKHRSFVRAVARRLLRDENRVDDVVQETWIAALTHPPRVDGRLRSWLAAVARNLALRKLRDESRRARREQAVARPEHQPARDAVADLETHRKVVEAVLALDEPYRSTILLRFQKGLSPGRIAKLDRVPAGTVRRRTHAGLNLLRARLGKNGFLDDERALAFALLPLAYPRVRGLPPMVPIAGMVAAVAVAAITVGSLLPVVTPPTTPRANQARHPALPAPVESRLSTDAAPAPATVRSASAETRTTTERGAKVPRDAIHGVVYENDEPLPGGRALALRYESYRHLAVHWRKDPAVRRTDIDANGSFAFTDLEPGRYIVGVSCDGRPLREANTRPGRRVEVRFGQSAITGLALDPVGRPYVGAQVQVNRSGGPVSVWAEVGADGVYYADALPRGRYWVAVIPPGALRVTPGVLARKATLTRGKTVTLDLGRAAALPRWTGVLRDAAGAPVGPARIQLDTFEGGYSYISVNRDGRFVAPFLPDRYRVHLHVAGHAFVRAGSITLPDTDHWQDLAVRGACVRGRLARPDRPTRVRLEGTDYRWVDVEADGTFVIHGVPVGSHKLKRKPAPIDLVVHVAAGQTAVTLREAR